MGESRAVSGILPHGGTLVQRIARKEEKKEWLRRAEAGALKTYTLSPWSLSDLELIATGAFSPLDGFMGRRDYESVVRRLRLASGLVWSLPIVLPAAKAEAERYATGDDVLLAGRDGKAYGVLRVEEMYVRDSEEEATLVYGTADPAHPGVSKLLAQGDVCLGGPVWLLDRPSHAPFERFCMAPADTRDMFRRLGWKTIVGFQTRNPLHRTHEYIQKCALETVDGLLLHPLIGETKADDIPASVRMESYEALFRSYYPQNRVRLVAFPAAMRYAGPREAVFHALVRKNYGCTHFIVGRDHAGVGSYYGPYDAQRIFDRFAPEEIGIVPMVFEHSFYCRKCAGMASAKTCPHGADDRLLLSGTKVREMLRRGEAPPAEFTRKEVADILIRGMRQGPAAGS